MDFLNYHQFMIFDSLIAITVKSSQILLDWMEKDKFYPSPIFFEPQRLYISSDALLVSPLGPPKPQPLARTCRGGAGSPARLRFVVPQEQQPAPPEPQLASETLRCRSRRLPPHGPCSKLLALDSSCYRSHSSFPPPELQRSPRMRRLTQMQSLA
jgi:hypothetical protein